MKQHSRNIGGMVLLAAFLASCGGTATPQSAATPLVAQGLSLGGVEITDNKPGEITIQNTGSKHLYLSVVQDGVESGDLYAFTPLEADTVIDLPAGQTLKLPVQVECPIEPGDYTTNLLLLSSDGTGEPVEQNVPIKATCNGSSEADKGIEQEVDKDVKYLEQNQEADVLSYVPGTGEIVFKAGSAYALALKVGDVIVADPIENIAPAGMAQKVTAITTDARGIVVSSSEAPMTDVFSQVDIDGDSAPSSADIDQQNSRVFLQGMSVQPAAAASGDLVTYKFDEVVLGNKGDKKNQLTVSGEFVVKKPTINFDLSLNIKKKKLSLKGITNASAGGVRPQFWGKIKNAAKSAFNSAVSAVSSGAKKAVEITKSATDAAVNTVKDIADKGIEIPVGADVTAKATVKVEQNAKFEIRGVLDQKGEKKIALGTIQFAPKVIPSTPPIVIIHKLDIFLNLKASVNGEIKYTITQEASFEGGLEYKDGQFKPVADFQKKIERDFLLYGNLDLSANLGARYEASIWGKYNAYVEANAGVSFKAAIKDLQADWKAEFCRNASAGIDKMELELPIINPIPIMDEKKLTLMDNCEKLFEGTYSLPVAYNVQYKKADAFNTIEDGAEVNYGKPQSFQADITNKVAGKTYGSKWKVDDGTAENSTSESKELTFDAADIGKEKTIEVEVGEGQPDSLSRARKKTVKVKVVNAAPTVTLELPTDPATKNADYAVKATINDANEDLTCDKLQWSSSVTDYAIKTATVDGKCVATFKFFIPGSHKVAATIKDSQNALGDASNDVTVNEAP